MAISAVIWRLFGCLEDSDPFDSASIGRLANSIRSTAVFAKQCELTSSGVRSIKLPDNGDGHWTNTIGGGEVRPEIYGVKLFGLASSRLVNLLTLTVSLLCRPTTRWLATCW